jgi:outer membrane receptor protein involved in Fe transport
MRTSIKLSIATVSLAVGMSACRDANANGSADQAELKRDLEMAATATVALATPRVDSALLKFEAQPPSAPQVSRALKKGSGNKVVHSHTPTVRSEPVAEVDVVESEVTETVADATAPESTEPVAVAPRPTPVVPVGNTGDYGTGGGIFGGGSGGGVVIRGGGVDGDNCELHRRGAVVAVRSTFRRGPVPSPEEAFHRCPAPRSASWVGSAALVAEGSVAAAA